MVQEYFCTNKILVKYLVKNLKQYTEVYVKKIIFTKLRFYSKSLTPLVAILL